MNTTDTYTEWKNRQIEVAEAYADLAMSRSDEETAEIEARIAVLSDQSDWPAAWHSHAAEAQSDPQLRYELSEYTSDRVTEITQARQVPEMEESPW